MKIGLVCTAANLFSEADRFRRWMSYTHPNVHTVVVASGATGRNYNKAKALNEGLRRLIHEMKCDVVIQTDVDYLVPPGIVEWSAELAAAGKWVWCLRRDIEAGEMSGLDWPAWMDRPVHGQAPHLPYGQCWGSWNALSAENWLRVGGFDERCRGWGGEDDVLASRLRALKIPRVISRDWPLVHVAHPPRANYHAGTGTGNVNKAWETQPQINYLADTPIWPSMPAPGDDDTWASLLTCPGREVELARTLASAEKFGVVFDEVVIHADPEKYKPEFDGPPIRYVTGPFPACRKDWILGMPVRSWTLLWEDDWQTVREVNLKAAREVVRFAPDAGLYTFPHWPGDPVEATGWGTRFRRHQYLGEPTGPRDWTMAFDHHWPHFSFNPGLHPTALLRLMVEKVGGDERALADAYTEAGFQMLHPVVGCVNHIGTRSRVNPGHVWKFTNQV